MSEAIANNPGLDAAQASLRASQDNLRSGYGIFFPAVDADAAATRERYSPANLGQRAPGSIFNLFTLSAIVSYALDVFGGQRRLVEGLRAEVDVAHANEQATYLTLPANIVNTVIARAAYQAEIEATRAAHRTAEGTGTTGRSSGTSRHRALLERIDACAASLRPYEATIPQLQQKLAQSDDLLAALAGHAPAEWKAPEVTLGELTLPERPAGQLAVRSGAPASGHSGRRGDRACGQREYRRGDRRACFPASR